MLNRLTGDNTGMPQGEIALNRLAAGRGGTLPGRERRHRYADREPRYLYAAIRFMASRPTAFLRAMMSSYCC